ncbi:hypothetical protein [Thermoplasma volcanium GSS1]|uniref:Transcription regulator PadR N-terminal domain-containing protein n=1 Tax=Thermoplasma volcanium (strain ATCC 51530 / DSM 4299 / JCM 9571 / NBRC 15438 / GSS1) TaxID=273116 RepID=Q97BE0_THEVO|nr:PadR family transcriptional regulator [Thermoplasma volcanium]BAB59658.1 hypothetical protein [Thermoplasma volcanium GSS1]
MDTYATRILILLSGREMTLYEISKRVDLYSTVSHGTVFPVIKKLLDGGFIKYRMEGNKKLYYATEKGQNYVTNIQNIGRELKEKIMEKSMGNALFYLNLLSSDEDAEALRTAIGLLMPTFIRMVEVVFRLYKDGKKDEIGSLVAKFGEMAQDGSS